MEMTLNTGDRELPEEMMRAAAIAAASVVGVVAMQVGITYLARKLYEKLEGPIPEYDTEEE